MSKASHWGWRACWLLIATFVLLKMPVINLPAYHDETYVVAAGWEILQNGFWPIPGEAQTWGHTPLTFELVAFAWFLFGTAVQTVHVVSVALAAVTLLLTYLVGKTLWDDAVGLAAAMMLAVCPLFFAQAGILHLDVPATTFWIAAIYCLVRQHWLTYILFASLMVLSKETTIILIPLMAGYAWLKSVHLSISLRVRRTMLAGLPLLSFFFWITFHKTQTGFWWGNPVAIQANVDILTANLAMGIFKRFVIRGLQVLWSNHHFVLLLVFLLALVKSWPAIKLRTAAPRRLKSFLADYPAEAFLLTSLFTLLLFHSFFGFLHPRYLLPAIPVLFLLTARSLSYLLGRRMAYGLVVILPMFTIAWFLPPDKFSAPEATLDYIDIVKAHQAASAYLERYHHNHIILASAFQAGANLTTPYFGYVIEPLKVLPIGLGFDLRRVEDLRFDLAYVSSTDQFSQEVNEVVLAKRLREERRFAFGRHFVMLYR